MKIICLGDSNTKRNKRRLLEILPDTELITCYTLEEVLEKIPMIQEDYRLICIIHVLTNDVANICQKYGSEDDKVMELHSLADNYVNMIFGLRRDFPNLEIYVSMVMPRFDNMDELENCNGRDIVNDDIYKKLVRENRVTLLSNNHLVQVDFDHKKFHLTDSGFLKVCNKWKKAIDSRF